MGALLVSTVAGGADKRAASSVIFALWLIVKAHPCVLVIVA
jgi:hypothetical protein